MLEIKLCANCKRSLSGKDIDSRHAVYQEDGKLLCLECLTFKTKKKRVMKKKILSWNHY